MLLLPLESWSQSLLYVSRERVLQEVTAARELQAAEKRLTDELQAQVDRTREALNAEERELADLRGHLSEDDFNARVMDFDQRVRRAREMTQERAGTLQRAFQQARQDLVDNLPRIIELVRIEMGAAMIVNASEVLAADQALDATDKVILRFEAEVEVPPVPNIDTSALLFDNPGSGD